jgi:soluble lytic murein transglycosylase-like protein
MSAVQKAIFPAIVLSSFLLISLNHFVQPGATVSADHDALTAEAAGIMASAASSDGCVQQAQYPEKILPWCALIEEKAGRYAVDPLLIAAVMLVESGGQPQVISHSGAVGLMQVMPRDGIAATFQCINGPCFASRPTIEELMDPEFNVDYGVRMLAGLIAKHGNTRDALRAYGPGDVGYWYADKVLGIYVSIQAEGE